MYFCKEFSTKFYALIPSLFDSLYRYASPYFSDSQFGFRKQRSCITQLLIYLEKIYNSLDSDDEIHVIYTDYEKDFDNVDHGILLQKLYKIGIRGRVFKLMQSYLANRTQRVRINGTFSEEFPVTSGVPQGSILASLLFLLYINDLPLNCKNCQPLLCADDAKFISINSSSLLFQLDLSRIKKWSDHNKLPLSVKKCTHLDFGNTTKAFFFSGNEIQKHIVQKDLGLLISRDLKWADHIRAACNKAIGVLCLLKRSSPLLTMSVKLNLLKSMIIPVLIYGSSCWYANIDNLKSLENVQKRALKWVCSDRNSTYKELLLKTGILPLSLYMQLQDLLTLSKCMTGYFAIDFNPYLCLRKRTRDIRSSHDVRFDHRKPRKSQSEQSFFFRTSALVNRLPATIDINNPTGLKQRLLRVLWTFFNANYNELVSATWRV